jgi:hypothetical protein
VSPSPLVSNWVDASFLRPKYGGIRLHSHY